MCNYFGACGQGGYPYRPDGNRWESSTTDSPAYQQWLMEAARDSSDKFINSSQWLSQEDIDRIDQEPPVTKYPLYKRVGIWFCCAVFCVAGWLIIINGYRVVRTWWGI